MTTLSPDQHVAERYTSLFGKYGIPQHHHDAFLRLVISNELDTESDFVANLNANTAYQNAMEDALAIKYATLREVFEQLTEREPEGRK